LFIQKYINGFFIYIYIYKLNKILFLLAIQKIHIKKKMFSKHSLLNKRPNMKQFNKIGGSFKDDDDDFFSNSFTKS
jgi:hypothetical protein